MKIILSGKWIFDSNLLVYAINYDSPFHSRTEKLFLKIKSKTLKAVVTQQNILETHKVLIRLYKKTPSESVRALDNLLQGFGISVIHPFSYTIETYHALISQASTVSDLFDYYLAATMLDNGINRILIVNTKDFNQIPDIEAINPFV